MKNIKAYCQFLGRCFYYLIGVCMGLMGIGLLVIIFQFDFGTHFFEIDTCLDRGGAWHYSAETCFYTDEEQQRLEEQYGPANRANPHSPARG